MPDARVIPIKGKDPKKKKPATKKAAAPAGAGQPLEHCSAEDVMPDSAPLPGVEEHVDWDTRVAGALAFLRRRITGDYKVDDFGFDPNSPTASCWHRCACCTSAGSGSRPAAWRTSRTPVGRCWWPTTREPWPSTR